MNTSWNITARWDIEPKKSEVTKPTKGAPISWDDWLAQACSRDYHVAELYHTDSGYYGAWDKATKRLVGAWVDRDGGLGYFECQ